jgi:biopolymer transport protein ExbD
MNNLRWINGIASRLIASAADRAPESCSERLHEEWLAHSLELSAATSRLKFALGCYWAVMVISRQGLGISVTNAISTAPTGAAIMTAHARPAIPLFAHEAHSTAAANILCEINTTPLIDVMLVLLITLILTLPILTHGVRIELPHGTSPPVRVQPEAIDLDIEFDGTVLWNGNSVQSMPQLESYFRAEAVKDPQPEIHLRPNSHVRYDVVAKVLALAQRNQLKKVGFINTGTFQN